MKLMRLSCDTVHFLGVSKEIPMDNPTAFQFNMLEECFKDGTIDELKKICDVAQVYGLLCNECDRKKDTFTYKIVCENRTNIIDDRFENITLNPSTYVAFKREGITSENCTAEYNGLCDEIWKEYFPNAKYKALINPEEKEWEPGYAIVQRIESLDDQAIPKFLEMWIPIHKIEQ